METLPYGTPGKLGLFVHEHLGFLATHAKLGCCWGRVPLMLRAGQGELTLEPTYRDLEVFALENTCAWSLPPPPRPHARSVPKEL